MSSKKMCPVHMIAFILVFIGGLNWGLVGLFDLDLVKLIFGSWPLVVRIVYILVGLSALMMLTMCKCSKCGVCDVSKSAEKSEPGKMPVVEAPQE